MALPGDCLRAVNALLCLDNPDMMFATAFFAILDTATGDVVFSNAGHNPPYLLRNSGNVEVVPSQGAAPLGVLEEGSYRTGSLRLAAGALISDALGWSHRAIDERATCSADHASQLPWQAEPGRDHPSEIVGELVAAVDQFIGLTPVADDVTVLAVKYSGHGSIQTCSCSLRATFRIGMKLGLLRTRKTMQALGRPAANSIEGHPRIRK
jgi:sigma-B regulation protein RsbU (phosphoserine phosphatase)